MSSPPPTSSPITVDGVVNLAPVVEAGANQAITLPANVTSLSGTATDDGLPAGSLTTAWSKVSGPGTVTFANAAALATDATFSMQGVYVLQLSATDGLLSGSDTVTVTVNANPANKAIDFGGTNAFVTLGAGAGPGRVAVHDRDLVPPRRRGRRDLHRHRRRHRDSAGHEGDGGSRRRQQPGHELLPRHPAVGRRAGRPTSRTRRRPATTVVAGTTAIVAGPAWHHAAATYDGTTWRLYLDGQLERELVIGAFTPRFDSIQHAAIGTALNSTGGVGSQPQGFFNGVLDESRIWNYARSPQQINRGRLLEIRAADAGTARTVGPERRRRDERRQQRRQRQRDGGRIGLVVDGGRAVYRRQSGPGGGGRPCGDR